MALAIRIFDQIYLRRKEIHNLREALDELIIYIEEHSPESTPSACILIYTLREALQSGALFTTEIDTMINMLDSLERIRRECVNATRAVSNAEGCEEDKSMIMRFENIFVAFKRERVLRELLTSPFDPANCLTIINRHFPLKILSTAPHLQLQYIATPRTQLVELIGNVEEFLVMSRKNKIRKRRKKMEKTWEEDKSEHIQQCPALKQALSMVSWELVVNAAGRYLDLAETQITEAMKVQELADDSVITIVEELIQFVGVQQS
ncbi:uncharacterized protein VTP21DRAFT_9068 [Calcarisporiella thermophila]|uniref:uncharacterized protein n=1 Tax=Calcarisporiella thermophila TaxID=911321 RepID=UPI003744524D